ncbi:hypothetical protein J2X98_003895 [Pseudarthrobacter enclensis]|uniref:Uncharacterized protein n=1 Tax=Pseudarthrobacter enclensis TaxID=993070 RepID=A0ABT9RYG2_9MICC|nr:hypothetical protein [Pseudarthrobacter enclensis]
MAYAYAASRLDLKGTATTAEFAVAVLPRLS